MKKDELIKFDICAERVVFDEDELGLFDKLGVMITNNDCNIGFKHRKTYVEFFLPMVDVSSIFSYEISGEKLIVTLKGVLNLDISKKLKKSILTSIKETEDNFFYLDYIGKDATFALTSDDAQGLKVILDQG